MGTTGEQSSFNERPAPATSQERADSPAKSDAQNQETSNSNCLVDLVKSAANSAMGDPLRGLAQIADSGLSLVGLHADLDGKLKSGLSAMGIEKPSEAVFGTANWYTQQLGNAAGMMVPYMATRFGVGRLAGTAVGEESALLKANLESGIFSRATMNYAGHEAALSTLSGFAYGTVLRSSNEQNVGSWSFLGDRFYNGASDGATFGLLGLTNPFATKIIGATAGFIERPLATEGLLSGLAPAQKLTAALVRNPIASGALSGIPGGIINAEVAALHNGDWVPSGKDLKENVAGMMFIGGAFGGAHWLAAPLIHPKTEAPTEPTQRQHPESGAQTDKTEPQHANVEARPSIVPSETVDERPTHGDVNKLEAMFGADGAENYKSDHGRLMNEIAGMVPAESAPELRKLGDWIVKNSFKDDNPEGSVTSDGVRRVSRHWFDLDQSIRDLPLDKFMEQMGVLQRDLSSDKPVGPFGKKDEMRGSESAYAAINLAGGQLYRGELITLDKALSTQGLRKIDDTLYTPNDHEVARPTIEQLRHAIKAWEVNSRLPLELVKEPMAPWQTAALSHAFDIFDTRDSFDHGDRLQKVDELRSEYEGIAAVGRTAIVNEMNLAGLVAAKEMHPQLSEFEQYLLAAAVQKNESITPVSTIDNMNGKHFVDFITSMDKNHDEQFQILNQAQWAYDQRLPIDKYFEERELSEAWPNMKLAIKLSTIFKDVPSDKFHDWLTSLQKQQWEKASADFPVGSSLTNKNTAYLLNQALQFEGQQQLSAASHWLMNNSTRTDEISATIAKTTNQYLSRSQANEFNALRELGFITDSDVKTPEVRQAARDGLGMAYLANFSSGARQALEKIPKWFGDDARDDIIRPAIRQALAGHLEQSMVSTPRRFLELNILTPEDVRSDEIVNSAKKGLAKLLLHRSDDLETFLNYKFLSDKDLKSPEIQKAAHDGLIEALSTGRSNDAAKMKRLGVLDSIDWAEPEIHKAAYNGLADQLEMGNLDAIKNLADLKAVNQIEIDDALKHTAQSGNITHAMRGALRQKIDFSTALKRYLDIDKLDEPAAEALYRRMKNLDRSWADLDNIQNPFDAGAAEFGTARMLRYSLNPNVPPHDALFGFNNVIDLYKQSGLSKEKFYGQVLGQVAKDDAIDDTGSSFSRLNAIARAFPKDINTVLDGARRYPDIKTLQNLAAAFPDAQKVFGSWPHLQRFGKLQQFVEQVEILPELQKLRLENGKLADWIEALAFHPDSRVSKQFIIDFWQNPEKFIDYNDAHSGRSHELKKPSNYVDIPNLGMTPVELRDALVNGVLDRLQVFSPMKVEYQVGETSVPIAGELDRAIGSRSEGRDGAAKSPTRLFADVNKLLKPAGLNVKQVIAGAEVPTALREQVESLLYDKNIGINRPSTGLKLVAEIHRKSDPLAVVAGDDTASCMGFGSGKNNIYMFNPNDALFTVRLVREDGTARTIAQSVLTKDKDIKIPFPTVLSKLSADEQTPLHSIIPEEALPREKAIIAADNVEVHPNYRSGDFPAALEAVYRDFFGRYVKEHGQDENLRDDKIIIGQGYSETVNTLPREDNTFVPQAPVGYSDKTHDQVYSLSLSNPQKVSIRTLDDKNSPVANRVAPQSANTPGITPLTFEDTLPVAYLEGKAFEDNSSLRVGLHNLENALIAKDIQNTAKGRPNLSLKYSDADGTMKGYLLAYEGEGESYADGAKHPMIYISDLSSDRPTGDKGQPKATRVGGKLMMDFANLYKQNYLDKGNMLPIFMNAREGTSYDLVTNHLTWLGNRFGYDFEIKELSEYPKGSSHMHDIVIIPHKLPAS